MNAKRKNSGKREPTGGHGGKDRGAIILNHEIKKKVEAVPLVKAEKSV